MPRLTYDQTIPPTRSSVPLSPLPISLPDNVEAYFYEVATAPQNITILAKNTSMYINWSEPVDSGEFEITNYYIYRQFNTTTFDLHVKLGNVTTFEDENLTVGEPYQYQVCAVTAAGQGERSFPVMGIPCTIPSSPENVTAIENTGEVLLTWDAPTDMGGLPNISYKIYRNDSISDFMQIGITDDLNFTDLSIDHTDVYNYFITAWNYAGESNYSDIISITLDIVDTSTTTDTDTETSTPTDTDTETSTPTDSDTETSTPTDTDTETSTPTEPDTGTSSSTDGSASDSSSEGTILSFLSNMSPVLGLGLGTLALGGVVSIGFILVKAGKR
jgi:hypothetical protein